MEKGISLRTKKMEAYLLGTKGKTEMVQYAASFVKVCVKCATICTSIYHPKAYAYLPSLYLYFQCTGRALMSPLYLPLSLLIFQCAQNDITVKKNFRGPKLKKKHKNTTIMFLISLINQLDKATSFFSSQSSAIKFCARIL